MGLTFGMMIGVVIGALTGQLALCTALGLSFGVLAQSVMDSKKANTPPDPTPQKRKAPRP
jgi:hypothetical protein